MLTGRHNRQKMVSNLLVGTKARPQLALGLGSGYSDVMGELGICVQTVRQPGEESGQGLGGIATKKQINRIIAARLCWLDINLCQRLGQFHEIVLRFIAAQA